MANYGPLCFFLNSNDPCTGNLLGLAANFCTLQKEDFEQMERRHNFIEDYHDNLRSKVQKLFFYAFRLRFLLKTFVLCIYICAILWYTSLTRPIGSFILESLTNLKIHQFEWIKTVYVGTHVTRKKSVNKAQPASFQVYGRIARWSILKPKIPIWVNFGVSCNEWCW
jgi:hypothetical protein